MTVRSLNVRPRALLLMAHAPHLDPRVDWVARSLSSTHDVCKVGMFGWNDMGMVPALEQEGPHQWRVQIDRAFHADDFGGLLRPYPLDLRPEIGGLLYLKHLQRKFESAQQTTPEGSRSGFPDLAQYIYDTNQALVHAARLIGPVEIVLGCDFEALPAAVIIGRLFGAPVVYDAHEYWPYSMSGVPDNEIEIWRGLDRLYAQRADYRIAVSDHLAQIMAQDYEVPFIAIPNAVPFESSEALMGAPAAESAANETVFLFQGNFAEGRGLQLLIDAWPQMDKHCILKLRGHDNPYKNHLLERAQATGLLGSRIFFPEALPEGDLIRGAAEADVGLIPYEPVSLNNMYCCPNKLSQYMAAGIPILSNDLVYVKQQIEHARCGLSVPFGTRQALVQAVNRLAYDPGKRREMGLNGRRYFETEFNWDNKIKPLMAEIASYARTKGSAEGQFRFDWIDDAQKVAHGALQRIHAPWLSLAETYLQEVAKNRKAYEAWEPSVKAELLRADIIPSEASGSPGIGDGGQTPLQLAADLRRELWTMMSHVDRGVLEARALENEAELLKKEPVEYSCVLRIRGLSRDAEALKTYLSDQLELMEVVRQGAAIIADLQSSATFMRKGNQRDGSGVMLDLHDYAPLLHHIEQVTKFVQEREQAVALGSFGSGQRLSDRQRCYLRYVRDLGESVLYQSQIDHLKNVVGLQNRYWHGVLDALHILRSELARRRFPYGLRSRVRGISMLRQRASGLVAELPVGERGTAQGGTDWEKWHDADVQARVRERRDKFQRTAVELGQILNDILAVRFKS